MAALTLALLFGGLAYISLASSGEAVFNWLLAISGLSQFFTWGSICLCHIRFRTGWKRQGHSLSEIPFKSAVGVIGSVYGLVFNVLCLIAQFYVAIWSPSTGVLFIIIFKIYLFIYYVGIHCSKQELGTAQEFFQSYLTVPIVILTYIGYKFYYSDTSKFVRYLFILCIYYNYY